METRRISGRHCSWPVAMNHSRYKKDRPPKGKGEDCSGLLPLAFGRGLNQQHCNNTGPPS
eukprot:9028573-Lingulodinium_polyedra.AAC.1